VIPLELWDLEARGATLFEARDHPAFADHLADGIRALRDGTARRRSGGPLDARCRDVDFLFVGGGGAAQPRLTDALAATGLAVAVCDHGPFVGERGGLALLGDAGLVVDVGQTAVKLSWRGGRLHVPRDPAALPPCDGADDRPEARPLLRAFLGGAIARAVALAGRAPSSVLLALPAELDDAGCPGGCTYPGLRGDRTLARDVLAVAGLDGVPTRLVNDAELSALSARPLVPPAATALVLTLGLGVGGALLVPHG
jgi:hypothetical protein